MPDPRKSRRIAAVLGALLAGGVALADEAKIVERIAAFFKTSDVERRQKLAAEIAADPAYDRAKVSGWLHAADLFEKRSPGERTLQVPLPGGQRLRVLLRIPTEYDPGRPWPLIYALHGSGGNAASAVGYVARLLGDRIDEYVVAAPEDYHEQIVHHDYWPPLGEHPAALRAIRQQVHVDSDRVYMIGYSMGGHTCWTQSVLHADQFAGTMPLAGSFVIILSDKLWDSFIPNLRHLPLTCVWGAQDTLYSDERIRPEGGIAGVNRKFLELAAAQGLKLIRGIELPEAGHSDVIPPADAVAYICTREREHSPRAVQHTFRHIYQASAYWLEGHEWVGDQWTDEKRTVRLAEGENPNNDDDVDEAVGRMFRGLLGELKGSIDGQDVDVRRQRVEELTIWFHEGMIDWAQPVRVKVSGRRAYEGTLSPSLYVALSQAARTWDFDRLRWAGLRFRSGKAMRLVGPETEFPTLGEMLAPGEM